MKATAAFPAERGQFIGSIDTFRRRAPHTIQLLNCAIEYHMNAGAERVMGRRV